MYVDNILITLHNSRLGCIVKGLCVNSFMYADDLIILSASVSDLQQLVTLCEHELGLLELTFNVNKCFCLRIGNRFKTVCNNIVIGERVVSWVDELRYLGVFLQSGHILKFNVQHNKKKFYHCSNSILSKTGNHADLVLSLCNSFCVPVLLYGSEVMGLTKTETIRLASPFNRLFFKLFKTFDADIIAQCQQFMSCLPLDYIVDLRVLKFLVKFNIIDNFLINFIFQLNGANAIISICAKYKLDVNNANSWKGALWQHFMEVNNMAI